MVIANVNTPRVSIEVKCVYSQGRQQSYSLLQGFWALVKNKGFPQK